MDRKNRCAYLGRRTPPTPRLEDEELEDVQSAAIRGRPRSRCSRQRPARGQDVAGSLWFLRFAPALRGELPELVVGLLLEPASRRKKSLTIDHCMSLLCSCFAFQCSCTYFFWLLCCPPFAGRLWPCRGEILWRQIASDQQVLFRSSPDSCPCRLLLERGGTSSHRTAWANSLPAIFKTVLAYPGRKGW